MSARIIVDKALDPGSVNKVYHVTNPKAPPFQLAVDTLRSMGYEFEEIPYIAWRERLLKCAGEDNALRPLEIGFGRLPNSQTLTECQVDCRNAGIFENTTTAEQLKRDFTWCVDVKCFPPLPKKGKIVRKDTGFRNGSGSKIQREDEN